MIALARRREEADLGLKAPYIPRLPNPIRSGSAKVGCRRVDVIDHYFPFPSTKAVDFKALRIGSPCA
jgi:hypothetical protein